LVATFKKEEANLFDALTTLGSAHYVHFAIVQSPPKLVAFIVYDGTFTTFVKDLAGFAGASLDELLTFIDGGDALKPIKTHVAQFTDYVAANDASQQPRNKELTMYSAYSFPAEQIVAMMPSEP
jgi:hypothetical protein